MFKFTQNKLPAVLLALSFVLTACGGGSDATGSLSSNGSASSSAKSSPSFLPTTDAPPSAQEIAIQKEGARLNSEELAQIAKTGVLPIPFDGPLLSGAVNSSNPTDQSGSSVTQSSQLQKNAGVKFALSAPTVAPAYRFYNSKSAGHFFTTSTAERDNVIATLPNLSYEGPAFSTSSTAADGLSPVHRFYNTATGVHLYTISEAERANVAANLPTFNYEGIAYYASTVAGSGLTPLYRFYFASKGFHFYTTSISERDNIIATLPSYTYEGIGYYVFPSNGPAPSPTPAVGAAQGFYSGSFSTVGFPNGQLENLVLEDDSYFALYGNRDTNSGALIIFGLIQGNGTALNNGTFSSSNLKDYFATGQVFNGSLTATYQPGAKFEGTIMESGESVPFSGLAPAAGSTSFNYNTPAQLSAISGAWSGSNLSRTSQAFTVLTSGALSGTDANGCNYSGSILPRSSGKNVFNANLTLAVSPACGTSSGITLSGVAITSLLSNGGRQLIISATSSDRSLGTVLFAYR